MVTRAYGAVAPRRSVRSHPYNPLISVDLRFRPAPDETAPLALRRRVPHPRAASRRVRRNRFVWSLVLLVLVALLVDRLVGPSGHGHTPGAPPPGPRRHHAARPGSLDPDWRGDGRAVTFGFGGDVHFPVGTTLGDRLADDPATALGATVPRLLSGADLSMVNLESALTNGTCPDAENKEYVFYAPASALTAFRRAGVTLITEANNHGEDCGAAGLQMALAARRAAGYPVLGIGGNVTGAFAPYRTTIHGERIAVIAATQVIDSDLQAAWTATPTQAGLASAYDVAQLVHTVQQARRTADTVVVYLHWGTELDACPNPLQEPLADLLVKAGADIVVGTHAHVVLGGGFLGRAYVDYGLGNLAFYDDTAPEDVSGTLMITATGRRIDTVAWRPAVIKGDLPQPLSGNGATEAITAWDEERSCTGAAAAAGAALATVGTETTPAPAAAVAALSRDDD